MSRILTNEKNYYDIADTIRQMKNVNTTYKPREMASALKDIYSNEVEGTLPLTFESNGMPLLDYRIDGASDGVGDRTKNLCPYNKANNSIIAHVESGKTYSFSLFASFLIGFNLMKRNASSQSTSSVATKYNSEGNVSATFTADEDFDLFVNGFSSISGKTFLESVSNFQLEEGSTATDYEPYGYKVPVVVSGKNLLQNTATSQTINGVIFTVNGDGSVDYERISMAERDSDLYLIGTLNFPEVTELKPNTNYIFSGGANSKAYVRVVGFGISGGLDVVADKSTRITYNEGKILLRVKVTETGSGTFYPMIRLASVTDDTYEPYIEPTTTNIYLDEPIGANESISLSDTEVDIPTIEGTNTLTIDTTVQPSNVYVQARKDSDDVVFLTQILEEGI